MSKKLRKSIIKLAESVADLGPVVEQIKADVVKIAKQVQRKTKKIDDRRAAKRRGGQRDR